MIIELFSLTLLFLLLLFLLLEIFCVCFALNVSRCLRNCSKVYFDRLLYTGIQLNLIPSDTNFFSYNMNEEDELFTFISFQ